MSRSDQDGRVATKYQDSPEVKKQVEPCVPVSSLFSAYLSRLRALDVIRMF